jgi:signal transduction histidine kinase/DNA-binding response OmpR family regulator
MRAAFEYFLNIVRMIRYDLVDNSHPQEAMKAYINSEKIVIAKLFVSCLIILRAIEFFAGVFTFFQSISFFTLFSTLLYFLRKNDMKTARIIASLYMLVPLLLYQHSYNNWTLLLSQFLPVTFPIIALMTTRSLTLSLVVFTVNTLALFLHIRYQTIDYINSIAYDKVKLADAITYQLTYSVDCGFLVLISMLTQIYSSRNAILQLFTEKDKLLEMNEKYVVLNKELKKEKKGKDEFLLGVSHELRNPLNILLGNLELSQMKSKDNTENQYLQNAKVSGELLSFLINNLLDAGKLQSQDLGVTTTPINLQPFIERIWRLSKMMFQRKNLNGQLYFSKEIPKTLWLDPHRVMQIVLNLVTNAIKFTLRGEVTIIISWIRQIKFDPALLKKSEESEEFNTGLIHKGQETSVNLTFSKGCDEQDGHEILKLDSYNAISKFKSMTHLNSKKNFHKIDFNSKSIPQLQSTDNLEKSGLDTSSGFLKIEVRDTGCGVDRDKIPELFRKFSQVSENSDHQELGAGLGLWIVHNLCNSMGGGVTAHCVKGVGSTFVAAIKCHVMPIPPDIISEKPTKSLRALIVDDMKGNAEIHKYFLNKCAVRVPDIATNGLEAVDLYQKRGNGYYDIIFMDRNMPLMDGDTASQLIRAHEEAKGWKKAIIVFVTGHCKKEDHDILLNREGRNKADYVFVKPFIFQVCQDLVNSIISKRCELEKDNRFSRKILVVDDNNLQKQFIVEYLSNLNIEVLTCSNGKDAMDVLTRLYQEIGLIFMDCDMPIMDGFETTQRLKSYCTENRLHCPPIIGLTGHTDIETKNKCLEVGMTGVEIKPISFATVQRILDDFAKYN